MNRLLDPLILILMLAFIAFVVFAADDEAGASEPALCVILEGTHIYDGAVGSTPFSVNLPPGTLTVTVQVWDDHPGRASQQQTGERVLVQAWSGNTMVAETEPSGDAVPDDATFGGWSGPLPWRTGGVTTVPVSQLNVVHQPAALGGGPVTADSVSYRASVCVDPPTPATTVSVPETVTTVPATVTPETTVPATTAPPVASTEPPATTQPPVVAEPPARPEPEQLAVTGAETPLLAGIGILLVIIGLLVRSAGQRIAEEVK